MAASLLLSSGGWAEVVLDQERPRVIYAGEVWSRPASTEPVSKVAMLVPEAERMTGVTVRYRSRPEQDPQYQVRVDPNCEQEIVVSVQVEDRRLEPPALLKKDSRILAPGDAWQIELVKTDAPCSFRVSRECEGNSCVTTLELDYCASGPEQDERLFTHQVVKVPTEVSMNPVRVLVGKGFDTDEGDN